MKRPGISMERFEQMAREMGCSVASKDDPLYSEGYSVAFLSRGGSNSTPNPTSSDDDTSTPPPKPDTARND